MAEQGYIRIHGQGEIEVEFVTAYLADLRHAYNSILVFETTIETIQRSHRNQDYTVFLEPVLFQSFRRSLRLGRIWPSGPEEVSSLVRHSEQLILVAVRIQSPGFWEFLGQLNPLEVIRKYLNDRHERRKDRQYRETAEARRLRLRNLELETKVLADRIRLAKEIGATERDLAPLLNELVYRPLANLDRHQDRGVIEHAEIPSSRGQSQG